MGKNPRYSLFVSQIPSLVGSFVAQRDGYSFIAKSNKNELRFEFSKQGVNKPGFLICYILNDGRVSFQVCGSQALKGVCEQCRDEIVKSARIPDVSQKTITIKNVALCDVKDFLQIREDDDVVVEEREASNDTMDLECCLCGDYGARVHVSHYKNGTLCLQGVLTEFFVTLSQDVLGLLKDVDENVITSAFEITNTGVKNINEDLAFHINDLTHIQDSVISLFISTTLVLMNSQLQVGDYGCHTFGLMKAIDALLRKRMQEDGPLVGSYYQRFQEQADGTYCFSDSIITYNDNIALKNALEDAYTFYHKHRHTTFHVDDIIESSRILTFDDALDIVHEGLSIINRICNNW